MKLLNSAITNSHDTSVIQVSSQTIVTVLMVLDLIFMALIQNIPRFSYNFLLIWDCAILFIFNLFCEKPAIFKEIKRTLNKKYQ